MKVKLSKYTSMFPETRQSWHWNHMEDGIRNGISHWGTHASLSFAFHCEVTLTMVLEVRTDGLALIVYWCMV